jgi:hypothetical protein
VQFSPDAEICPDVGGLGAPGYAPPPACRIGVRRNDAERFPFSIIRSCVTTARRRRCVPRQHKTMKRTKTITIETQQVQIIRRRTGDLVVEAWCASCAAHVAHLTPEAAAQRSGRTTRELYRQVEAGELHFGETAEGGLLLCLSSLFKQ